MNSTHRTHPATAHGGSRLSKATYVVEGTHALGSTTLQGRGSSTPGVPGGPAGLANGVGNGVAPAACVTQMDARMAIQSSTVSGMLGHQMCPGN